MKSSIRTFVLAAFAAALLPLPSLGADPPPEPRFFKHASLAKRP